MTGAHLSDGATRCSCERQVEPGMAGDIQVLRVAGEIDVTSIPMIRLALGATINRRPADLVVDLAGVIFCCVRGFALLATTGRTARSNGITFAVSGMTPHLDRIATILWPEQPCVRYRSVATAVTAIRTDHSYRPASTAPQR